MTASRPFSWRGDSLGNGQGSKLANVDGSVTPQYFYIKPRLTPYIDVHRMIVFVRDAGAMDVENYGNIPGLTNGISLEIIDTAGNVLADLADGDPIKSNGEWQALCYDATVSSWGTGDEVFCARWTFAKAGRPITLKAGNSIRVGIHDDLTGLVSHLFTFQGLH